VNLNGLFAIFNNINSVLYRFVRLFGHLLNFTNILYVLF